MYRRPSSTILSTSICACVVFTLAACKNTRKPEALNARSAQSQAVIQNPGQAVTLSAQPPAPACTFEWLDAKKDAKTWEVVVAAFQEELRPDQATGNPQEIYYPVKQIERIGRCGNAGLVHLEKRSMQKDWGEPFGPSELYNFDLSAKTKSKIQMNWPLWAWKYRQLARFEDGSVPDVTFETATCSNCDAALVIVSSLKLDSQAWKWQLRRWVKGNLGVLVYDMNQETNVDGYRTLSGIGDFDGSGHDEVAVWTRYRDVDEKEPNKLLPPVTTLSLFSYRAGAPVETEVKGKAEMSRIKKRLCQMNPQEEACKNAVSP